MKSPFCVAKRGRSGRSARLPFSWYRSKRGLSRKSNIQASAGSAFGDTVSVSPARAHRNRFRMLTAISSIKFATNRTPGFPENPLPGFARCDSNPRRAPRLLKSALKSTHNPRLKPEVCAQTQLKSAQDAIARGVAGIVVSPTDSSTCPSVLALAQKAKIPVVIGDIGTNEGEYVSFVISDNREGANGVGKALVAAMKEKGMADGTVGLVTISLTRNNGKKQPQVFARH
jgi:hypothetical protein